MRKTLGIVLSWTLAVSSASVALQTGLAHADDWKVGLVDMNKALQTTEAGKTAKANMEKDIKAKQTQIQTEEASIRKSGEEFKKQAMVLSDEARAKKQAELQERIMKYEEMRGRSQAELQQKERDLTAPIIAKLRTIIADLAKKKGYKLVLEKNENTVLYSEDKDDFTAEVVTAYNKGGK